LSVSSRRSTRRRRQRSAESCDPLQDTKNRRGTRNADGRRDSAKTTRAFRTAEGRRTRGLARKPGNLRLPAADSMRAETYDVFDHLFPSRDASFKSDPQCHLCADAGLGFIGRPVIWGNGPQHALIMAIGRDSSGLYQAEPKWCGSRGTGIPFTNKKSGLKLRIMLHQAGMDPSIVKPGQGANRSMQANVGDCGGPAGHLWHCPPILSRGHFPRAHA